MVLLAGALAGCSSGAKGGRFVTVSADPGKGVYAVGDNVTLSAQLVDENGKATGADFKWSVDPPTAVQDFGNNLYELDAAGDIGFKACLASDTSLCHTLTLVVDDGSPGIVLDKPVAGAELGPPDKDIAVSGSLVASSSGNVFVNGKKVDVDSQGRFSTSIAPRFGINHIEVVSSDGLGAPESVERDVMWAQSYLPATQNGKPSLALSDAASLRLGQRVFDDGVGFDPAVRPVVTHDLADVLTLALESLDRSILPPNPVIKTSELQLFLDTLRLSSVNVQLEVVDGGLDLFAHVGHVVLTGDGQFASGGVNLGLKGSVDASVAAFTHLTIDKQPGQPVSVKMGQVQLALENITSNFQDPNANALFAVASSLLRQQIEAYAKDAVQTTIEKSLPSVLQDILNGVDQSLSNVALSVPLPLPAVNPPVNLLLSGGIDNIDVTYHQGLQADLGVDISTDATALFPKSRGVATTVDAALAKPPFYDYPRLQLALRLTLLNGMLHELWNSGMLSIDMTQATSFKSLTLDGRLPPVVRLPRAGEQGDLVISVGQLQVKVVGGNGASETLAIDLDASANVSVADNQLSFHIQDKPALHHWVIQHKGKFLVPVDSAVTSVLEGHEWPALKKSLETALAIKLPVSQAVGALAQLSPTLANFKLSLGAKPGLDLRGGYLFLDGTLEGRLP